LAAKFSTPNTVIARVAKPVAIDAQLVSANSLKPKKQPVANPKPKPKPKPKPTPKPRPSVEEPPSQAVRAKEPVKVEQPEPQKPESELPQPSQQQALSAEALANLEASLRTDRAPQEGLVASASDTVAAIIQRAVINRWTRPPSARNGMRAVLEIALVPTGDVVGVAVLSTSGNQAFDRSAINAVEKAGRFPEVKELERALFERDFRRFQLIFKPEDLRY
jgi:colicin import membrane protein